jgi:histidyl-tRNA synthetase
MLKEKNIKLKNKDEIDLFFVQLWDEAKWVVLPLSLDARKAGINTVVSLWTPSMKEQMLKANRSNAKFVVLVWLMEARNWVFQVKDTISWTQEEVKKEELINYIIEKIGSDNLDFYVPTNDLITE